MQIINRLSFALKSKQLKEADLCRYLGITTSTMSTWKTRQTDPPTKYIMLICEFLNVSPVYLLTGENPPAEVLGVSPEAAELARRWDTLDADGKALVRAELVRAEDRSK